MRQPCSPFTHTRCHQGFPSVYGQHLQPSVLSSSFAHLLFVGYLPCLQAICSHIAGGATYAVLLDSEAYARGSSCTIDGPCHVTNMPGEHEHDTSDGASTDSLLSSGSPVHGNGTPMDSSRPLHKGAQQQPVTRESFKAAAAAALASGVVANMAGIVPGPAAANLQAFGPGSPFGSSNGSVAGSAYGYEIGSDEDLVHAHMIVSDKAQAAALFPVEEGAFGRPQPTQYGRY